MKSAPWEWQDNTKVGFGWLSKLYNTFLHIVILMISILVSTLAQWSILKSNRQFPYCMFSSSTMNIVSGKEIALNKEKNLD